MGMRHSIAMLLLAIGLIDEISSECSVTTSLKYQEIDEANYSRNWTDIINPGTDHPLGFYINNTVYGQTQKNPCISLDNVSDRHVEVMFETSPKVPLCFKVNGGPKTCESSGRHQSCSSPTGPATNLYEFVSDSGEGASESDVSFWYRLVRGPTSAEDPEDGWCMKRENKYPGDLLQPPPNFTPPPESPKDPNSSVSISALVPLTFFSLLLQLIQ